MNLDSEAKILNIKRAYSEKGILGWEVQQELFPLSTCLSGKTFLTTEELIRELKQRTTNSVEK